MVVMVDVSLASEAFKWSEFSSSTLMSAVMDCIEFLCNLIKENFGINDPWPTIISIAAGLICCNA